MKQAPNQLHQHNKTLVPEVIAKRKTLYPGSGQIPFCSALLWSVVPNSIILVGFHTLAVTLGFRQVNSRQ
jgi:hypothetical protein